jgi:hypothetical protein
MIRPSNDGRHLTAHLEPGRPCIAVAERQPDGCWLVNGRAMSREHAGIALAAAVTVAAAGRHPHEAAQAPAGAPSRKPAPRPAPPPPRPSSSSLPRTCPHRRNTRRGSYRRPQNIYRRIATRRPGNPPPLAAGPGRNYFGEQLGHRQPQDERDCPRRSARGIPRRAPFAGQLMRWLSAWAPPLPRWHRRYPTRAAPQRHLVAEHAPVITAHAELDERCSR